MRVILDTNVLVGALISPYGFPNTIYHAWREAHFELVTSEMQFEELKRVSRYPKLKTILPAHRIGTMINNMHSAIVLDHLPALPEKIQINDQNDNFLIAMAIAGGADYLITGDLRSGLLRLDHIGRTRVLTPETFCTEVL
jgi:hypothetical protein